MVAVARALTRDGATAEDLAQEAFVAAHRHWARISRYENPKAWVRRVLVNKATSFRRRRGSELRALVRMEGQRTGHQMIEVSEDSAEVWRHVSQLPRRQAQAVALFYVGELSVDEIAEVMQCQNGSVKSHLHRARTKLSRSLSGWDEGTT